MASGRRPGTTRCRIDTPVEVEYYRNGDILQTVIRKEPNESRQGAPP